MDSLCFSRCSTFPRPSTSASKTGEVGTFKPVSHLKTSVFKNARMAIVWPVQAYQSSLVASTFRSASSVCLRALNRKMVAAITWEEDIRETEPRTQVNMLPADQNGEMTVVGKLDILGLSEAETYALLTDHKNSHKLFQTILSCQQENHPEDSTILLDQTCQWKFLVFSGTFPVHLAVKEDPQSRTFTFRDVSTGGFLKSMHGSWAVSSSPLIPGGVRITHRLQALTALTAPPPFGKYTQKIFKKQVKEILKDLEVEITRRSNA